MDQFSGFFCILSDELLFPLTISVLGEKYTANGIEEKCDRLKWVIELINT